MNNNLLSVIYKNLIKLFPPEYYDFKGGIIIRIAYSKDNSYYYNSSDCYKFYDTVPSSNYINYEEVLLNIESLIVKIADTVLKIEVDKEGNIIIDSSNNGKLYSIIINSKIENFMNVLVKELLNESIFYSNPS